MFKQSVGLSIQHYVILRNVNKYCTRYILTIQNSKLSLCVLYCFSLVHIVRIIYLQKENNISKYVNYTDVGSHHFRGKLLKVLCSTHYSRIFNASTPGATTHTQTLFDLVHVVWSKTCCLPLCGLSSAEDICVWSCRWGPSHNSNRGKTPMKISLVT